MVSVARATKGEADMRNPVGWAALTAFSLAFFAFIYAPLFVIIGYSFNSNPVNMMIWEHFTFDWYRGLLGLSRPRHSDVHEPRRLCRKHRPDAGGAAHLADGRGSSPPRSRP